MIQCHGDEHVKKMYIIAVIHNEDAHSNVVSGHCFTGEDTNIFCPLSFNVEGDFLGNPSLSHLYWHSVVNLNR